MNKLAEKGIMWIDESSIYVADKVLYENAADFLNAVIKHIKNLVDTNSEDEAGWCEAPEFSKYARRVYKNWMRHIINNPDYEWELCDVPGKGHREVWCIDFGVVIKEGE